MPRADWGIKSSKVDDFDRDSQYKIYTGPTPPSGTYLWVIKSMKRLPGTREKNPQWRVGLELVPRTRSERKYDGFFVTDFIPVSDKTDWRYVPLLDAIGVTGRDFTERTIHDENGNVQRIGKWKMDGQTLVFAQLTDNDDPERNEKYPKQIQGGAYAAVPEDYELDDESEEDNDDDEYYDDEEEDDEYYDEDGDE